MVVSPVEITGALPHSVSPTESTAEPGRRPVALQTIPKEATDLKFSVSTVGRASKSNEGMVPGKDRNVYLIGPVDKPRLVVRW